MRESSNILKMPLTRLKIAFGNFEKALLPFKGFFDYEFGEEKLQEVRRAIELGATIDPQFLKALDMLKFEAKKLRTSGIKLRRAFK